MVPAAREEVHGEGATVRRAPGVDPTLARRALDALPERWIHRNRRGGVAEVRIDGERYARKHYRGGWLRALRGSPARRTFRLLLAGAERGWPLPAPVCLARGGGETVLVTRWWDGDHIHLVHAGERARFARDPERLEGFIAAIVDAVIALFRAGIVTRDLAPQNFVVGEGPDGFRAALVDLDDARELPRVPPERVLDGLAQLGHLPPTVPARHRLRFLARFLARGGAELLGPLARDRRALRRELARRVAVLDREKAERLRAKGAVGHPYAGWGLDEAGRPNR